ncbi:Histone-lysine N-methyltransferase SETMAR [Eumeta japonica]|uniref:Histone-lysine N-methyltransferase SETMAR n=1 Tax=Eumeta variegata TaxID=151549 RepID=A0A4C1SUU0_EUMVA|nr:Histone-lysine N-methyltransferase SETMAR [Eumeta japonica]
MDILLHAGKKPTVFYMSVRRLQQTKKIEADEKSSVLEKVRKKRARNRILLHRDNASPYTESKTMSFLTSEKVRLVTHSAFSPDLAPCHFFIFPKMKDLMGGLIFTGPEETMIAFNQHVQNMPSDQWSCFKKWFEQMKKCVKCNGEFFERQ